MIGPSTFVLDANVFIQAARTYYAFDVAPGFWKNLKGHAASGRLLSIDRIKKELEKVNDKLKKWATNDFSNYFVSTHDNDVIEAYKEIINWVQNNNQFSNAAKYEFAESPDGWLIAYAKAKGCIVVTHEALRPAAKNKVPIPNVCNAFNIKFINTFEMLRQLGVQLI